MRIYSSPVILLVMPRIYAQQGAIILERPRNKSDKAIMPFRFFGLYFAYPNQMLKAFLDSFHMPEHHGSRTWQVQLVRGAHNIQPFLTTRISLC